jgi:hypothetical protein
MVGKTTLHAGNTVLLALIIVCGAAGQRHEHVLKAHVHFLATSTSVHFGEGQSQDIYLIELAANTPGGQPTLARLVDEYPSSGSAFSAGILRSSIGTTLRLRRDFDCDITLSQMPIRTAPGDPLAALPVALGFQPALMATATPDDVLPCYRTARSK